MIISDSTFYGFKIEGNSLHPLAKKFLETKGFKVSFQADAVVLEKDDMSLLEPNFSKAAEAVQKEIDRLKADADLRQVLAPLYNYSKPYALSFFGHHHEERVNAVIKAIKTSPGQAHKILNHQLALMSTETPSLDPSSNSNIVATDLLSYRWQTQLPKHRTANSGYARAIRETIDRISATPMHTPSAPPTAVALHN